MDSVKDVEETETYAIPALVHQALQYYTAAIKCQ